MTHRHDPLAGVSLTSAQAAAVQEKLKGRDRAVAEKARASVKPEVVDLEALRVTVAKYAEPVKPAPSDARARSAHTAISYWKGDARYRERSGDFVAVSERSLNSPTYQDSIGRALQVVTPEGPPTVTADGLIRRGCVVCGRSEIVADKVTFGPHRGAFCIKCHVAWNRLSIPDRRGHESLGRFVTLRLQAEGLLEATPERTVEVRGYEIAEPLYLRGWKRYVWAYRLKDSSAPEKQEPVSTPFGYLAGPIQVGEASE